MTTLTAEGKNGKKDKTLNMHYFFFSIGSEGKIVKRAETRLKDQGKILSFSFGLKRHEGTVAPK